MMTSTSTISFYYGDVVNLCLEKKNYPKMPCQAVVSTDGSLPIFFMIDTELGISILFYGPLMEPILMEDQM